MRDMSCNRSFRQNSVVTVCSDKCEDMAKFACVRVQLRTGLFLQGSCLNVIGLMIVIDRRVVLHASTKILTGWSLVWKLLLHPNTDVHTQINNRTSLEDSSQGKQGNAMLDLEPSS